jgi:LysM repeat protein
MQKLAARSLWLLSSLGLLLLASGCALPAGSALESTRVAVVASPDAAAQNLPTEEPSATPTPDFMPIETTPAGELIDAPTLEVVQIAELPSETPTPDALATFYAESTSVAETQIAAQATPTFTPDFQATLDANSTAAAETVVAQFEQTAAAQPTATLTPDALATLNAESTQIAGTQVADASLLVQDEFAQTATALAIFGGADAPIVDDPLTSQGGGDVQQPPPDQGLDPLFLTATAAVQIATFQAAVQQTETMAAILGLNVTPSPTFDFSALTPVAPPEIVATTPVAPLPGGSCEYIVQRGDNLFRISLRFNTTVHELAAVNGIPNINLILVGQRLIIPNCTGVPPQTVTSPPPGGSCRATYTVRQNDTLFRISLTYGVTVHDIAAVNPAITNINLIYIDQQLCIP